MDRRSWLWRRKSSDKSPGETDSSVSGSGSVSSPSDRFSDEHQASPNQSVQSPEVTSKVAPPNEDANDGLKILTEKLSAAAATITAKEELVKQHAKVAEEAVTGWEKAENEVVTLKQQLDAATKKNSLLEDRAVHLDEALKECLRQLRQVKEEKEEKIHEVKSKKSEDTESKKSELEVQMSDLRAQLEAANAKVEAAAVLESDFRHKLSSIEKENDSLRHELRSQLEELKLRTLERDLSTKTAENASKQHLESIKKVAKLEAECRKLRNMARKTTLLNDSKSVNNSQSDSGERLNDSYLHSDSWKSSRIVEKMPPKNHMAPSPDLDLMDDFLEMEKLAALPAHEDKSRSPGSVTTNDNHSYNDSSLKSKLDAMIDKTSELEEKIETIESEKAELASALTRCQDRLKLSEAQLNSCQNQLKISQAQLREANKKLGMLQAELELANELRQAIDLELDDANVRREEAESRRKEIEEERENLLSKVSCLEGEAGKERELYAEASAKCRALEDELSNLKHKLDHQQSQLDTMNESKEAVEKELSGTTAEKEAAESQLKDVNAEAKRLLARIGSLENEAKQERELSAEFSAKCKNLEDELSKMKHDADNWQSQLASANHSKDVVTQELQMTIAKKEEAELQLQAVLAKVGSLENELSRMKHDADNWQSQLASVNHSKDVVTQELQMAYAKKEEAESQLQAVLAKVGSLENEIEKEKTLSAELSATCKKLESQLTYMKSEGGFHHRPLSKDELDKQQEEELALAASKLAECKKTIASLGNQLKSLATLEDLFLESEKLLDMTELESQLPHGSVKPDALSSETAQEEAKSTKEDATKVGVSSDKQDKQGFGKFFSLTKNTAKS